MTSVPELKYSCDICGRYMDRPCSHWTAWIANPQPTQPVPQEGRLEELVAPIGDLIAYHEKEAKDHVSSKWIYGEHMMAVGAYKKVLRMIAELGRNKALASTEGTSTVGPGRQGEGRRDDG